MVQLKKKVTLKTKIADSDVKQDIQPKNTAPQEPVNKTGGCLLYTSPSPRDLSTSRMPSSA